MAVTGEERAESLRRSGRADLRRGSLRQLAARGAVVNGVFMVFLSLVSLMRGFVVAIFLGPVAYGVWGIVVVTLGTLVRLRDMGIGDKYIQQDEEDQTLAYQRAFTLELMLALSTMVVLGACIPVFAALYGRTDIVAPSLAMLLLLPAMALSAPVWVYYRRMNFVRQRLLQAVDPLVAFAVTVALAVAGAGYWSFVVGTLVGAWTLALAAMVSAPIAMRLRFSKDTLKTYAHFSWPLLASGAATVVLAQGSSLATNAHLGVAAVGFITLAATLSQFAGRVQQMVEQALYPAVCAVRDQKDLLRESFLKSNRVGMVWGVPFALGLALFFADIVHFGIGDKWEPAIPLLQITGLVVAMSQVFFNWDAYFRAEGDTKPIAIVTWSAAVTFVVAGIPLLLVYDLPGLAVGIALQGLVALALRTVYVRRFFGDFGVVRHALAGLLPVVPGVVCVLAIRALESGPRTVAMTLAEAAVFVLVTALAVWRVDGPLVGEFGRLLTNRSLATR